MSATSTQKPVRYVAYYRVSTQKQGVSGLGLEAQQTTVANYISQRGGELIEEFKEVESGRKTNRVQLRRAINRCKAAKATLIIAKLDRLSRNATFMFQLQDSNLDIVACDCPEMDKFSARLLAVFAEREAELISQRTKAALAEVKKRGDKVGGTVSMNETIRQLAHTACRKKADDYVTEISGHIRRAQHSGFKSLRQICAYLDEHGVPTAREGRWQANTVRNVLARMERLGL